MSKVKYVVGDLFAQDADAIGHGVNCKGAMGAGIAVLFKKKYPDMYAQYKARCDANLLWPGDAMPWVTQDGKVIFNLASQDQPGPNARNYWLHSSLKAALDWCTDHGLKSLAIPRIGAGIGGLTWETVQGVCDVATRHSATKLVVVSLPEAGS